MRDWMELSLFGTPSWLDVRLVLRITLGLCVYLVYNQTYVTVNRTLRDSRVNSKRMPNLGNNQSL